MAAVFSASPQAPEVAMALMPSRSAPPKAMERPAAVACAAPAAARRARLAGGAARQQHGPQMRQRRRLQREEGGFGGPAVRVHPS